MKFLSKASIAIFIFILISPILSLASGGSSSSALDAYQKGMSDEMIIYTKNYLNSAKGKDQIDRYYIPWLKNKAEKENIQLYFEWLFYPTYFCDQDPASFLDVLDDMITKETCTKDKQGKKTCKKEARSIDEYADQLLSNEKTANLHILTHEQLVGLLNTNLGIDSVSSGALWGAASGETSGDGFPSNYLELRKQYKMAYPFKEKFVLYAPYGYSEIYGSTKHLGVDLNKSPNQCCGIKIYSVSSGLVTFKGQDSYGANLLIVKTGDVSIMYAHMAHPSPYSAGEVINKGDFVGYVGTTGYSTGCHLHLEMRLNNVLINPEVFIDLKNGRAYQ